MPKREATPGVFLEKTVIVWDELNADVIFFLVEGDQSHLNRIYINMFPTDADEAQQIELDFQKEAGPHCAFQIFFDPTPAERESAAFQPRCRNAADLKTMAQAKISIQVEVWKNV